MTPEQKPETVKVEQVDREAAEKVLDAILFATEPKMLSPEECEAEIVQAFARHRLASQPVPASSDLVDAVARVLMREAAGDEGADEWCSPKPWYPAARAIIPIVQADERESCAKVIDALAANPHGAMANAYRKAATAIRERSGG